MLCSQPRISNKGVVVTITGDSLSGLITLLSTKKFTDKITVKVESEELERTFLAEQIKGFTFDKYSFQTIKWNGRPVITKVYLKGPVTLYSTYYKQKTKFGMKNFEHMLIMKGELFCHYYGDKKREQLLDLIGDCPELVSRLENKDINFENIYMIVDLYNDCFK